VTAARMHSQLLDDQLCFSLYAASRVVTAAYRPILEELGLTYPQYLTMLVIWERTEVSMKELGEALELDYGTLTPLVKRLEAAGLVSRQRRPEDERAVHVVLTSRGTQLRERADDIPERIGAIMALSDAQFTALKAGLRALTDQVSDHLRR
jgi:MarR family transcriptional regulator, organic hydroperoxide resistance regulator